jgi:uncharacterized paraquat-inducible protein A
MHSNTIKKKDLVEDIINTFTKIELKNNIHDDNINIKKKPKREQVKNACVNCKMARKKCDDGRPCNRCTTYNIVENCEDSIRKPREKGIKRGSYKKKELNIQ